LLKRRWGAYISSQPSNPGGNFTSDANGNLFAFAIIASFLFEPCFQLGDQMFLFFALIIVPFFQIIYWPASAPQVPPFRRAQGAQLENHFFSGKPRPVAGELHKPID
jgi:hypothetical protein